MQEDMQKIINQKPLIMVVDDNKDHAKLFGYFLKKSGFESVEVIKSQGCLKKMTELYEAGKKIDCLVVDIAMPIINGFQLTKLVKKTPLFGDVPIIVVTAADSGMFSKEIDESEADLFLQKPIDKDVFIAEVKAMIQLTRYRAVCNLLQADHVEPTELLEQIRAVING